MLCELVIVAALNPFCRPDETLAAYGAAGHRWVLTEAPDGLAGADVAQTFGAGGAVQGTLPCNTMTAVQSAPYPWFEMSSVALTRRACADLEREAQIVALLSDMTLSEVLGDLLVLSADDGREMVFRAAPP